MCSAVRLLSASKRAGQLALRDRMIAAVQHVLLARPQQLDRRARHLLGDRDRLADVVGLAAPAEAAAEDHACGRRICRPAGRRLPSTAANAASPFCVPHHTSHLSARVERGGVHRLHGGVVLVRIGVDRLDLLRGAGDGGLDVAVLVADEGLLARRGLPSAIWRSMRSRPWRSRPRPRRSAARRARSWRATRCRRRRRRRCRRPARPS